MPSLSRSEKAIVSCGGEYGSLVSGCLREGSIKALYQSEPGQRLCLVPRVWSNVEVMCMVTMVVVAML
jgi:hypothetical protein